MFDFFFKRSSKPAPSAPHSASAPVTAVKVAQNSAKQTALAQAVALAGDEAAAAVFVAQCEFADARLCAAEHIRSRPLLENTLKLIRNADRRVAKLLQSRLDALVQQEGDAGRAHQCVQDAHRLAQQQQLMPNQVVALDRDWQSIAMPPDDMRAAFDDVRNTLRLQLEAQADLQRSVRNVLLRLCALADDAASMAPDTYAAALNNLAVEMSQYQIAPHAASLPAPLLAEFSHRHASMQQQVTTLAARYDAIRIRTELLDDWEQRDSVDMNKTMLKKTWSALPILSDADEAASLEQRFSQLLAQIDITQRSQQKNKRPSTDDKERFGVILEKMERALQDGSLQLAVDNDRELRACSVSTSHIDRTQNARLTAARAELHRLQAWARWGGTISRDELAKAAEALPNDALPVLELAKRIGSLRARWKSLDVSAGPASQQLWERFDAACSLAYAPAAAHFEQLAHERERNLQSAQHLIDDVKQFAVTLASVGSDLSDIDWRAIANFCMRTQQAWRQVGPIDRKERKRLDREFKLALQSLLEPLAEERKTESLRRKVLIEAVASIDPHDRSAVDDLRTLQDRWQQRSNSVPLERRDDQVLWKRFRDACDAVFAARKQLASAADNERHAQLGQKEDLCAKLEAAQDAGLADAEMTRLLRDVAAEWDGIGAVPRAAEKTVNDRYKAVIARLQQQRDSLRQAAAEAAHSGLCQKLQLCHAAEAEFGTTHPLDQQKVLRWRAEWNAFTPSTAGMDKTLRRRFDAALDALDRNDLEYAALLDANRSQLMPQLLAVEVMLGIDSPPALSRERLQLQVEVLKLSLKEGREAVSPAEQVRQLCALPAATDAEAAARMARILDAFRADPAWAT